jgi:hypothetical protein
MRERPVDREWPAEGDAGGWERFARDGAEVDAEHASWAETARAFGTTAGEPPRWSEVVGGDTGREARDGAGWRYQAPEEGRLAPEKLASVAAFLARHTPDDDDAVAGVWEGWGGLLGFHGTAPSRTTLIWSPGDAGVPDDPTASRHREVLYRSTRDRFNNVFRRPVWQPGMLSDEISRGPRLQLPDRGHVLFRGSISELADPEWPSAVPWADGEWTRSPSVIWPEDRSWFLATDVDADSTLVGGSTELIQALCADDRIEAHTIREGAALSL